MSTHERRMARPILEDWSLPEKVKVFLSNNLPRKLSVNGVGTGNGHEVVIYHDNDNEADIARAVAQLVPKEASMPIRYVRSPRAEAC